MDTPHTYDLTSARIGENCYQSRLTAFIACNEKANIHMIL